MGALIKKTTLKGRRRGGGGGVGLERSAYWKTGAKSNHYSNRQAEKILGGDSQGIFHRSSSGSFLSLKTGA